MANIKYLVKNLSSNIVLLSYQNSNDNMWNYQVVLRPGQTKNIWCVEGSLSHSGRNSDVSITIDTSTCSSITPTTSPTPIVGDSNPLVLTPVYYPGSIGVAYTLSSKYPSDTDITVSFTNILGTNEGGPITINSSVTLFIGEKSGSTQVTIDGDFTTLNDSSLFSDVIITTDGPSQYFETPISAPPLLFRPIDPIPIFEDVYSVVSCCYTGVTGYMQLSSSRLTPFWVGYVVVDINGDCYSVQSLADEIPTLSYGGSYYKSCKTCISRFPCDVVKLTPTPTPTTTSNPCDVTPTPTPTVSKACPSSLPVIGTILKSGIDTFLIYFSSQGCCDNLTVSWSSNNIIWNDSTAGCSSPRSITIANSSSYPTLYFRITQMCGGCNSLVSNVFTYNVITPTPTRTPGATPAVTPTISLTPSKTPTNTPTKTPTNTPTQTPLRYRPYIVQSCCDPSVTGVALLPTPILIGTTFVTTSKLCMTVIDKAPKGTLPTYTANLQVLFDGCEGCLEQNPCQLTPTPTPTQTVTPSLTLGYTPCIEITSECGTQIAHPGEIINGYFSYTFISGQGYPVLIYWEYGYWIVYNTQTQEKCAYLKSDSQYPVGTSSEWISSTPPTEGCSCLARDTGFNTVLSYCPTPTPTPTQTPTTTPAVCEKNLITNPNFEDSLSGWIVSSNSWVWSDFYGGSANYLNIGGGIFQNVLTIGATYQITFTLYNYAPCTENGYVVVFAGTNESSQISDIGVTYQTVTLVADGQAIGFRADYSCNPPISGCTTEIMFTTEDVDSSLITISYETCCGDIVTYDNLPSQTKDIVFSEDCVRVGSVSGTNIFDVTYIGDACGCNSTTIYIDDVCVTEISGPTPTPTSTITPTPTPSVTLGSTPPATPTNTPTPTKTTTPTVTPTVTPTGTATGCIDCGLDGYSYIISDPITPPFNSGVGFNSTAYTVKINSDGKIIVGGYFITYNLTPHRGIARINPNGSIDNAYVNGTSNGFNNGIQSLVIQSNGSVIAVGEFTTFNTTNNVGKIARLDANGNFDPSFNIGSGFNWSLSPNQTLPKDILLLPNDSVILLGTFNQYNGVTNNYIVKLTANGTIDSTFNVGGSGFGFKTLGGAVYTSGAHNGKIIVCGEFTSYNGVVSNGIIRLNSNGTVDSTFNVGSGFNQTVGNFSVNTVYINPDNTILVGGSFTSYNGTPSKGIVRLLSNGAIDSSFNIGSGINGFANVVRDIKVQTDGRILVCGGFNSYNGTPANSIVRINPNGTVDTSFVTVPGFIAQTYEMAIQSDGKIVVVGGFNNVANTTQYYVARLKTNGTLDV